MRRDPHPRTLDAAVQRLLSATFATVLLVGGAAMLANPALLRAPTATLRDGAWARAYQATLDAASPLRPTAATLWNALDLWLFRQAPAGVVLGAKGWLFSEEEYALPADPAAARAAWVAHAAAVAERLRADGVSMVVALVPAKASLVAAGQPPLPKPAAERYAATLSDLRDRGVEVVDLRPALATLGEAAWLRTDTHWTPAGATAAAAAIAGHLRALDPNLSGDVAIGIEPAHAEPYEGDLLRLLSLGPFLARVGPEPDLLVREQLVRHGPETSDLFAAVEIPVALVGTSYAADERWNLALRLEAALGVEVLDAAEIGRGAAAPMATYLGGAAYATTPPLTVVWEIPERYLVAEPARLEAAARGDDRADVAP